jgi:hypothetical protein
MILGIGTQEFSLLYIPIYIFFLSSHSITTCSNLAKLMLTFIKALFILLESLCNNEMRPPFFCSR